MVSFQFPDRPKPAEDDSDLLELQEKFVGQKPSVSIIKKEKIGKSNIPTTDHTEVDESHTTTPPVDVKPKKKKSLFAQRLQKNRIDSQDMLFGNVMSNVVEKEGGDALPPIIQHATGFPAASHRSFGNPSQKIHTEHIDIANGIDASKLDPMMLDIHTENLNALKAMSTEEVKAAKEELFATLSNSAINFLRKSAAEKYGPSPSKVTADKPESQSLLEKNMDVTVEKTTEKISEQVSDGVFSAGENKSWENLVEVEKTAWFDEKTTENNSNSNELRFDFSGILLVNDQQKPIHSGLYHHGDSPDLAGYSLNELVHLSKSTVPSQRIISFNTLSAIIRKVFGSEYSPKLCATIISILENSEVFLSARIGLDATHDSVVASALSFLCTLFGYQSRGSKGQSPLDVLDKFSLSKAGLRTLAMESDSIGAFKARSLNQSIPDLHSRLDNNVKAILQVLREDVVLGMLLSHIVVRLKYLLSYSGDDYQRRLLIHYLLLTIAQHSPSSAEDILACTGLVDLLMDSIVADNWPIRENVLKLSCIESTLKVLFIICQSSREATLALWKADIFNKIMRFITLIPDANHIFHTESFRIVKITLNLLNILFAYGLGGVLVDNYRSVLFDCGKSISVGLTSNQTLLNPIILETLIMYVKTISTIMTSFRVNLDVGGVDDAVLPFVDLIYLSAFNIIPYEGLDENQQLISNIWTFKAVSLTLFTTYTNFALTYQFQPHPNSSTFINSFIAKVPKFTNISMYSTNSTISDEGYSSIEKGTLIVQNFRLDVALYLLNATNWCEWTASVIDAATFSHQKGYISEQDFYQVLFGENTIKSLERLTTERNYLAKHEDWIRLYSTGLNTLINSWLTAYNALSIRNPSLVESYKELSLSFSMTLLTGLLPGEEYMGAKVLKSVLKILQVPLDSLSDVFGFAFNAESLQISRTLLTTDGKDFPRSFMMQPQLPTSELPISTNWCYGVPSHYFRNRISAERHSIIGWLKWIKQLEQQGSLSTSIPNWEKLFAVMHIFLLLDKSAVELFRDVEIQKHLDWCFTKFSGTTDSVIKLPQFYNFYLDLIDQYQAVSFGNETFNKYLLLPLDMDYPMDFRVAFWSKMTHYFRLFKNQQSEFTPEILQKLVFPKESNKEVLSLLKTCMDSGKITKTLTPVLYHVVVHNLETNEN
ncbi:hypothetical protein BC833DRAFT_585797 [Globomyces pollinis-pini]|nr:hypothetical protein BC833DRAFT_585797 [Globomyces pollinis-pini]